VLLVLRLAISLPCMYRDAKRQELLDRKRRQGGSPLVVAILPLSKVCRLGMPWMVGVVHALGTLHA
jgi:hypothetical protein